MKYKEESDMAKGGFPGGMGGMNMNNLMKQAQKMQFLRQVLCNPKRYAKILQ